MISILYILKRKYITNKDNILNQTEIEKIDIDEKLLSLIEILNEENNNIKSYIIEVEEELY